MSDPKPAGPFPVSPQPAPLVCLPPRQLVCATVDGQVICQCLQDAPPPPPKLCTTYIVYEAANPKVVQPPGPREPGCDQAGLEVAVVAFLYLLISGILP